MPVQCPTCGQQYDVTLFEFGRTVRCDCGTIVSLDSGYRRRLGPRPTSKSRPADSPPTEEPDRPPQ